MSTTLTFIVNRRAGNFARVLRALSQIGLKPKNGAYNKSSDPKIDSIKMNLAVHREFDKPTITKLRGMIPGIVDVRVESAYSMRSSTQTAAPPSPPRISPKPAPKIPSIPIQQQTDAVEDPTAAASSAQLRPLFNPERIKAEIRHFIGAYPDDIGQAIRTAESALNPSQREAVLSQLGLSLGFYAARELKKLKKNSAINNTVRGSLAMQKSRFGGLSPVIAGLMSSRRRKSNNSADESKSDILISELAQFLTVSGNGNNFSVKQCPHCASTQSSPTPNCYFITAFAQSFIRNFWGVEKTSVTQLNSRSSGAAICEFTVSGMTL